MSETVNHSLERKLQTTPIAIVGIGAVFPQARNKSEYWDNILKKMDCVIDVPPSRWSVEDYYDPDPNAPDKSYCKRGGFIPDIDFDPMEFGLPPNILEVTDVSQLLGLVVARDALEDAGYGEGSGANHEHTGVILGVVGMSSKLFVPLMARLQYPVWEKVLRSYGLVDEDVRKIVEKIKLAYVGWEENAFPGTIGNVVAGRIANRFDLGGTNCVVDAACGSSLAAVKMAIQELIENRADMMISGGVDVDNSIGTYLCFSKTPAFSKGQNVRTFDADTDGMMAGEGIGMVVFKRLADAERDQDRIYAVVRGVGSSSDGRFKSIYAPRPAGQAKALRRAYIEAGYSPATVTLIEAHGTGTVAGDPAEFQALREVFEEGNPRRQVTGLGSVKSQIAHTKATAGAASLIKVALGLYHKILPATINVNRPNPKLDIDHSPFYLNTETRPWFRLDAETPRRAGVSAFGFGGTNFHVTLEEYQSEHNGPYRLHPVARSVVLSAETPGQLVTTGRAWLAKLQSEDGLLNLAELVQASQAEISPSHARLGFVADTLAEAIDLLKLALEQLEGRSGDDAWEHPKGIFYRKQGQSGKVVALFCGQGSQYVNMGKELAMNFPPVRQVVAAMDDLFVRDGEEPLSRLLYPPPAFEAGQKTAQTEALQRTERAQPAIGAFSASLFKLLQQAGFTPDFVAGHSFGELTALWAGGVLSDVDYFFLARARGRAMAAPVDPNFDTGTMLAVKGDVERLREAMRAYPEITLANYNSGNQVVLAGSKSDIARVQPQLAEKGFSVIPLQVSAAFHTPLVGHAQKPFAEALSAVTFHAPRIPVFSNSTGKAHAGDPGLIQAVMVDHILNPVLFKDEVEALHAAGGFFFVEFGPKNVLTNLVNSILEGKPHVAVALNANPKKDSDRQLREAVVQLRVAGLTLGNIDPYEQTPRPVQKRKKSAVTVTLNGGLYLTEKTRQAFTHAIQEKGRLVSFATAGGNGHGNGANGKNPAPAPNGNGNGAHAQSPAAATLRPDPQTAVLLEKSLSQFQAQQSEAVRVQERYLQNEAEYGRVFAQLTQLEVSLFANGTPPPQALQALEMLERSMARFHDHQAETLRVHEQYMRSQAEFSQGFMHLVQQQFALTAPAPSAEIPPIEDLPVVQVKPRPAPVTEPAAPVVAPTAAPAGADSETVLRALLEIVSEKTGYPGEMLNLDMDMEADLGIDSIKRVEILGAMRERFPHLPKLDAATLAELRTVGQINVHLAQLLASGVPAPAETPAAPAAPPAAATVATQVADVDVLRKAFLAVVSEKTGYPTEMLELDMDLEADLGVDSIKKVEILGAMRTQFPDMPRMDAEALAELRTLRQITDFLGQAPAPVVVHVAAPVEEANETPLPESSLARGLVLRKELPAPDALDFVLPPTSSCLLTDDGSPLTAKLAETLLARGWKVAVLRYPQSVISARPELPAASMVVTLEDLSEPQLEQRLVEVQQKLGQIAVFIHLDPAAEAMGNFPHSSETEQAIARHVFLLAKHLKDALNVSAQVGRAVFMTVVHLDGEFGLGNGAAFEPASGGLLGLVKTLNLEWGAVFCRGIDISPEIDARQACDYILAELHDPNRLVTEVAYSRTGRSTLVVASEVPA